MARAPVIACPYCRKLTQNDLGFCDNCLTALLKYWEQNQVIVSSYTAPGFAQMAKFLDRHDRFSVWCVINNRL